MNVIWLLVILCDTLMVVCYDLLLLLVIRLFCFTVPLLLVIAQYLPSSHSRFWVLSGNRLKWRLQIRSRRTTDAPRHCNNSTLVGLSLSPLMAPSLHAHALTPSRSLIHPMRTSGLRLTVNLTRSPPSASAPMISCSSLLAIADKLGSGTCLPSSVFVPGR